MSKSFDYELRELQKAKETLDAVSQAEELQRQTYCSQREQALQAFEDEFPEDFEAS